MFFYVSIYCVGMNSNKSWRTQAENMNQEWLLKYKDIFILEPT